MRYKLSFDNGVLQLESKVDSILRELYEKYNFLWDKMREEEIEFFVATNPMCVEISDRFKLYDGITEEIKKLTKTICVRTIEINRERMIESLVEESKVAKILLGKNLNAIYRVKLEEMVEFIQKRQKVLSRDLLNLDDCKIALNCLRLIRENFVEMDRNLDLFEEVYSIFERFHISVPTEDNERVDGLRYIFNNMIESADSVLKNVLKLQIPLQKDLEIGLAQFKEDVVTFEEDFENRGPMIEGLSPKEAYDRVMVFELRLQDLESLDEIYSKGEELYGMEVNDYPMLPKRHHDIDLLNQLYKLYLQILRYIEDNSAVAFKVLDTGKISAEVQLFVDRCEDLPDEVKDWTPYKTMRMKIEELNECCPLLRLLASSAIEERHWTLIENVMDHNLDSKSPDFTLGMVLQAPLLKFKDEIEEICNVAIKEQQDRM